MGRRVSIMAKFYPVGPLRSGSDCSGSSPPGNVVSAEFAEAGPGCTKKLSQNLAHHPNRHCHENSRFHIHTRPRWPSAIPAKPVPDPDRGAGIHRRRLPANRWRQRGPVLREFLSPRRHQICGRWKRAWSHVLRRNLIPPAMLLRQGFAEDR